MHFVIVSAVFPPEPGVSAKTSADIAKELVKAGHTVKVIAPYPSRPSGRIYSEYRRSLWGKAFHIDGYAVLHVFSSQSRHSTMLSRLWENLTFGITSALALFFGAKPDAIYSNSWPIFASALLILAAGLRHVPVVVSVQDVYPESMVAQSRLTKQHWIFKCLYYVDCFVARRASALIVISEAFAEIYKNDRNVHPQKISVIPNWLAADSIILDDPNGHYLRKKLGLPANACLAVYAGNIGIAAGVESVVRSFEHVGEDSRLYLLIAGEGTQLQACQAIADKLNLRRILFHSPWLISETSAVLASADILILPTIGSQSEVSVPSKLVSYMLAARPVVTQATKHSELAKTVQKSGCGWVCDTGSPINLVRLLEQKANLPTSELKFTGMCGREYALREYTAAVALPRVMRILEQVGSVHH